MATPSACRGDNYFLIQSLSRRIIQPNLGIIYNVDENRCCRFPRHFSIRKLDLNGRAPGVVCIDEALLEIRRDAPLRYISGENAVHRSSTRKLKTTHHTL